MPSYHHYCTLHLALIIAVLRPKTIISLCYTSHKSIPATWTNNQIILKNQNTIFENDRNIMNFKNANKNLPSLSSTRLLFQKPYNSFSDNKIRRTPTTLFLNNNDESTTGNDYMNEFDDDDDDEEEIMDTSKNVFSTQQQQPLPPLPSEFMYDEEDEDGNFENGNNNVYNTPAPSPQNNHAFETHQQQQIQNQSQQDSNDNNNNWEDKMEEQQRQIDALMQLVKNQQQSSNAAVTPNKSSSPSLINNNSGGGIPTPIQTTTAVAPLKAMLFIDGTWLYYSIHQRREVDCPIIKKFGRGWQHYYKVDWSNLPRIVCEQLQEQQTMQGWSSSSTTPSRTQLTNNQQQPQPTLQYHRPVEIVRASVYTSYKKNTDKNSLRFRMFQEMTETNYDVHRMETVGNSGEKCVDIQLAVDLLHYATVPNAYDIAIMLSGDKDFVPALIRTRQKGKQVAIVSMRNGCNRALFESSHIKDYDVIWLDDFLDRLIVPIDEQYDSMSSNSASSSSSASSKRSTTSAFLMIKIVHDLVSKVSGGVSSRDIGRFLKSSKIGNSNMLDQMKDVYGGLRHFLAQHGTEFFIIYNKVNDAMPLYNRDSRDKSFLVEVIDGSEDKLLEEASRTTLSLGEEKFLQNYYAQEEQTQQIDSREDYLNTYYHTLEDPSASGFLNSPPDVVVVPNDNTKTVHDPNALSTDNTEYANIIHADTDQSTDENQKVSHNSAALDSTAIDYSKYTAAMLKQSCRERSLPVSGTKSVLVERITNDVQDQILKMEAKKKLSLLADEADQESLYSSLSDSSSSPPRQQQQQHQDTANTSNDVSSGNRYRQSPPRSSIYRSAPPPATVDNPALTKHLEDLIKEYIVASGGRASSRDVGRYLAANPGVISHRNSALKELKENYVALTQFLNKKNDIFVRVNAEDYPSSTNNNQQADNAGEFKFYVGLR